MQENFFFIILPKEKLVFQFTKIVIYFQNKDGISVIKRTKRLHFSSSHIKW